MIDSTSIQGSSGLATALRDRPTCVIPVQPNRSLPVRPAPHIPCRSILPRRTMINNRQIEQTSTELQSAQTSLTNNGTVTNNAGQQSRSTLGVIRINVPDWQNGISLPFINILEISSHQENQNTTEGRNSSKRRTDNGLIDDNSSNCSLIDISKSPERNEVLDYSISIGTPYTKNDRTIDNSQLKVPPKKRRKRREKKTNDDQVCTTKMVPPLRLKKIQSLQEKVTTSVPNTWEGLQNNYEKETLAPDIGFKYYLPSIPVEPVQGECNYNLIYFLFFIF